MNQDVTMINKHSQKQFKLQMINIADILVENAVSSYLKLGKNDNGNRDINEIHDGLDSYRFNDVTLSGLDIK